MADVMIAVEHVHKSVTDSTGTLTILRDIHFELLRGQTVAIVGASGSGKSTLLSIIAGLDTPSQGTVQLDGHDLFAMDEDQRAALRGGPGAWKRETNEESDDENCEEQADAMARCLSHRPQERGV